MPRPVHLAGQRLRRRPDKCDAGRRPSGRRIPRPAASGRTRSLRCTAFFPPKPLRWVSAGALLGEVIKTPVLYFLHFCVGGVSLPSGRFVCVGTTPRGVYFSRKNGFLRVGALRRRTRCSLLHTVLFRHFCVGGGITTLGVRFMPLKRWTPAGHGGVFAIFMPPRYSPCAG